MSDDENNYLAEKLEKAILRISELKAELSRTTRSHGQNAGNHGTHSRPKLEGRMVSRGPHVNR
jgi:hypothetical protein